MVGLRPGQGPPRFTSRFWTSMTTSPSLLRSSMRRKSLRTIPSALWLLPSQPEI
uniref:Macaca fascicularis brain cDNA clone: QflA-22838, similar to human protocadherin beta 6 (PCDHB6), mRNA, RefSeq: NM_018939.2 n=1 Tax=Macaca fascicularis TaxID=9541 RepID=I7G7H8_MACFA|nr:unnamed protein product [Macaca fascicularis]